MKRLFYFSTIILTLSVLLTSCLGDDNETKTTPTCMIAGFSVTDITSPYSTKTAAGKDTTYNRTISGSTILFNINQLNGKIQSVDSLPNWVNISKVVPNITYSGIAYVRVGGETAEYRYFRNGNDSIDFTKQVDFRITSTDGKYNRYYSVKMLKSILDADSLYWSNIKSNLTLNGNHRTLSLNDKIYVFADNAGNTTLTTTIAKNKELNWTTPANLSTAINYKSVTLFNGSFYGLDSDGLVYNSNDGINWTKTSETTIERLLGADPFRLYAYDGSSLLSTTDGAEWDVETAANLDMMPQMPVSSTYYATKTNATLYNVVMMGNNTLATYTPVWFKISSSEEANQKWNYINISDDNGYPMPLLNDVKMVRFKDMLIAIGGKSMDGTIAAYSKLYVSHDNGITWHVPEKDMAMVEEWKGTTLPITMVECNDCLWVIQSGGKIWLGEMSTN